MPYSSPGLAQTVPEFVSNEISVYWYGPLTVGTVLYPVNSGPMGWEGKETDIHASTVAYTDHSSGTHPIIDGASYRETREGWIKFKGHLGDVMTARVLQGAEVCFGDTALEIIELVVPPAINYEAQLQWQNMVTPTFLYDNQPYIMIQSITHTLPVGGSITVDVPDSGTVSFDFRHNITQNDLNAAFGNEIVLTAEIYDGPTLRINPVHYSQATSQPTLLSVTASLDMSTINNQTLNVKLTTTDTAVI